MVFVTSRNMGKSQQASKIEQKLANLSKLGALGAKWGDLQVGTSLNGDTMAGTALGWLAGEGDFQRETRFFGHLKSAKKRAPAARAFCSGQRLLLGARALWGFLFILQGWGG